MLREQIRYVIRHGPILALSGLFSQLLALLVIVAYNHWGTVEGYGLYSYVMAASALVGVTSLTGMASAILVAASQNKLHVFRVASRQRVKFSLILGCPLFLLVGLGTMLWFPQRTAAGYACLCLLPLFPFTYSFTGVYTYLNGRREFGAFAAAQVTAAFINLLSVAVCLRVWPDLPALPPVVALTAKTIFESGLYFALVRRDRISLLDEDKHLLSYGIKISLTGVSGSVETHVDRFIVGLIYGFENLAMFAAGRGIVAPLKQIAQTYYQLYVPKLARKSPAEAFALSQRALAWGLLFILPGFALIYWVVPWLYTTFLSKFGASGAYARVFLVMVLVGVPWYFYYPFFQSQRQARRETIVRWTRFILLLALMVVFMRFYGIVGVIYAEIAVTVLMSFQSGYEARKSRAMPPAAAGSDASPPPLSPDPADPLGPDAV